MKLKKAYIYLISFLSLSVMFCACYYFSYKRALSEFNKNAVERNLDFANLQDNPVPTAAVADHDDDSESVDKAASEMVLPTTTYVIETYDMKTNTLESQEQNPPGYLVGLTREGVIEYLENYMADMTLSEYNKGLFSYELLSFSEDKLVIRKTYNEDMIPYRFYVVVKSGYVVVYNSDLKSVYKYTHIEAKDLPEKDRIELSKGIYVDSLDELYSLLESYSS
ncbi:MAG: putative rane protein [Herbinix sp.]|nr:putative rane protein [Herbinix sp.]